MTDKFENFANTLYGEPICDRMCMYVYHMLAFLQIVPISREQIKELKMDLMTIIGLHYLKDIKRFTVKNSLPHFPRILYLKRKVENT